MFHISDEERISLREYSIKSPAITKALYCGRPGLVVMEIALEETTLGEIMLEATLLSNIKIPSIIKHLSVNICKHIEMMIFHWSNDILLK